MPDVGGHWVLIAFVLGWMWGREAYKATVRMILDQPGPRSEHQPRED
jgi:hypothetical protein